MEYFLSENLRSNWFKYPRAYEKIVEFGLVKMTPWHLLSGNLLMQKTVGLKERFPELELVRFAERDDCDDVACWRQDAPAKVYIIHDFPPLTLQLPRYIIHFGNGLKKLWMT